MAKRDQDVHFLASKEEVERIHEKMDELGIRSMGAYLRKMALDGYCIRLDLQDVKALVSLLRICSNNLNQYAKRANETGSIYRADIEDLQKRLEEIWTGHERSSCSPVLNPVIRQLVGSRSFGCGFYIRVDIIALWQIPLYNIIKRKGLSL